MGAKYIEPQVELSLSLWIHKHQNLRDSRVNLKKMLDFPTFSHQIDNHCNADCCKHQIHLPFL